jgi:hypothetical protein
MRTKNETKQRINSWEVDMADWSKIKDLMHKADWVAEHDSDIDRVKLARAISKRCYEVLGFMHRMGVHKNIVCDTGAGSFVTIEAFEKMLQETLSINVHMSERAKSKLLEEMKTDAKTKH